MSDTDRDAEFLRILDEALSLPQAQRATYLHRACGCPRIAAAAVRALRDVEALGAFLQGGREGSLQTGAGALRNGTTEPLPPAAEGTGPSWGALLPGERVAGFVVENLHAVGGTSEVYRAHAVDHELGPIALKVWRCTVPDGKAASTVPGQVRHPHLIEVHGGGFDPERRLHWSAMRLVAGPSMQEVLEGLADGGAMATSSTVGIDASSPAAAARSVRDVVLQAALVRRFVEVAGALGALHAKGLVHQDVKPANILFEAARGGWSPDQPAVLVDVGLVRPVREGDPNSTVWATRAYAAPEQLLGLRVDARTDVFGLGVTMHDVLSARLPAARRRPAAGLEPLRDLIADFDDDLSAIVAQATSPDRRWRYADGAALKRDLELWLQGRPVTARPRRALARAVRRWRRDPAGALSSTARRLVLAAAGALLLAGASWFARVWNVSATARAAWQLGDLATAAACARQLPAWLAFLLPAPFEDDGTALAAVREALGSEDRASARLLAARYLARDGPIAHAHLLRWFEHDLRGNAASEIDSIDAARVLSRVLLERVLNDVEQEAHAGVRTALEALLRRGRALQSTGAPLQAATVRAATRLDSLDRRDLDHALLLHGLAALGGCGTSASLPSIVEMLEAIAAADSTTLPVATCMEAPRLGLLAMERIARRSLQHADGPARPAAVERLVTLLPRAAAAVAGLRARLPDAALMLRQHVERLFALAAYTRRSCGLDAPDLAVLAALGEPPTPLARAAAHDPALALELRHGRGLYAPEEAARRGPCYSESFDPRALAELAALFADPRLESALRAALPGWIAAFHRDAIEGSALFDRGLVEARAQWSAERTPWPADPDSWLSSSFAVAARPWSRCAVVAQPKQDSDTLAAWNLASRPAAVEGTATGLELRAARVAVDGILADHHHVVLAAPGISALRLRFRVSAMLNPIVWLNVTLQMSGRTPLPYLGEAGVDFSLDGTVVHEVRRLLGPSQQTLMLPVCRADAEREHVLEIRLREDASTTVRVLAVRLTN